MKTYTINEVLVQVTEKDLEILNKLLNQLQVLQMEKLDQNISDDYRRYYETCMREAQTLWMQVYKIQKEMPF